MRQHKSSSHQKWQWQLEEMVKQCLDQFYLQGSLCSQEEGRRLDVLGHHLE